MNIRFKKYQGTGNDFIMIDNRTGDYDSLSIPQIQFMCDRKFGIGADGLIKINSTRQADFEVDYYNGDGTKSFCGNGARCAVSFCHFLGIDVSNTNFLAIDGIHAATFKTDVVELEMKDVDSITTLDNSLVINTGSPHYVAFVDDVSDVDMVGFGRDIRNSEQFKVEGINVNVAQIMGKNAIAIRTYERGVEDETLSCGTGATACAMAYAARSNKFGEHSIEVAVLGGSLTVKFVRSDEDKFSKVKLIGPAVQVFGGSIDV